jgi:hypothetical protein
MKMCYKCRKTKEFNEFHKNKTMKDGHAFVCRECVSVYYQKKKEEYRKERGSNFGKKGTDGPAMSLTTKSDWCGFYDVMKKLGYDINGDIHAQFAKKYGLPYKERPYRNTIRFKPEDCQ